MALPLVREIGSHDRQEIHDAVARLVEEPGARGLPRRRALDAPPVGSRR